MSFASPSAFAWALLAVPIVIFYILKIRMRRVPVSTTLFWNQVFEEKAPRSLWQQLRHLLSLLLQLLLLSILVFALADPYLSSDLRNQRRTVVVLDISASMQSTGDAGVTPFEAAVDRVTSLIRSLRVRDEMALIVAGARTKVVCGLTSHQRTLEDRLAGIRPTDGPAEISDAIATARMLLADHENGTVTVVSDTRFEVPAESEELNNVRWEVVGEDLPNVGITRFRVRRSLVDRLSYETLVHVTNFSSTQRKCKLDLLFDDLPIDVHPLVLEPNETWEDVITQSATSGGVLTAELRFDEESYRDGLTTDNRAFAVLQTRDRIPVELVTEGNWFLERVLEANDSLDVTVLSTTDVAGKSPQSDVAGPIRIFHQTTPDRLPSGRIFVVQPETSCDLWQVTGEIAAPLVGEQDSEHELMKSVRLDNVLMPKARSITPKASAEILAASVDGEPLYLRFKRAAGDVVVLTVDLDQGDLPLRTAFPILLINAINEFANQRDDGTDSISAGDVQEVSVPRRLIPESGQSASLSLVSPEGEQAAASIVDGKAVIGPLSSVGVWRLQSGEQDSAAKTEPSLQIACNLEDPLEGRLQRRDPPASSADETSTPAAGFPIWFWLAIVALLLLVAEWLMFQRRMVA